MIKVIKITKAEFYRFKLKKYTILGNTNRRKMKTLYFFIGGVLFHENRLTLFGPGFSPTFKDGGGGGWQNGPSQ